MAEETEGDADEEKKQAAEEEKEASSSSTPAPAPRSRRRTATPAAVAAPSTKAARASKPTKKSREQRQLFTKPDTVDEDEEEEAEEEEAEEKEQPQETAEEYEDQGVEADFSGHDQPAAASAMQVDEASGDDEAEEQEQNDDAEAHADQEDDDDENKEEQEEEDGDDAFVAEMAGWAAAELSRRLKAPPAAAAAAAAAAASPSSSSAAAAAASSTKARPASASASSRAAQSSTSTSDLNSLFVPRVEGGTMHHSAGSLPIPHGFQRKSGVLLLTDSAMDEALANDRASNHAPSAMAAPDLMAALGARSAAKQLPSSNPVQAAKQSARESNAVPTAGKDWFNLSRPSVITTEMKTDLKLLSLRAYMDPKKFFKKSSKASRKKVVPTFFQMGTVIAGAQEFYSSRLTNSERHEHFADEFIDPSLNRGAVKKTKNYLKRKVMEVQAARTPISTKKYSNRTKSKLEDIARRPGSSNKGGGGGGKKQRR